MTSMVRAAADILAEIERDPSASTALPIQRPTVLRWEDPPPPRGGIHAGLVAPESKYAPVADELRARPGDWGLIYLGSKAGATSVATMIRSGTVIAFRPPGDFDAVARTVAGQTRVYARYLGDAG